MSEETSPREVDPLAAAASGYAPPTFPVLANDRVCQFKIHTCKRELARDSKIPGFEMMVMSLKTTKDYPDKDGKTLRAGFMVFKRIGITEITGQADKRDRTLREQIGPELAMWLRTAGLGAKQPREWLNQPSMMEGRIVDCKVSIQPARDGFPESNGVAPVPPEK